MDTWEYRLVTHNYAADHRGVAEELNENGAEGWLLVAVIPSDGRDPAGGAPLFLIFARKVAPKAIVAESREELVGRMRAEADEIERQGAKLAPEGG